MPIDILGTAIYEGPEAIPGWEYIKTYTPAIMALAGIKYYFGGTSNTWERDYHGKVYIMTGATSGLGANLAYELASKGAQLILLVRSTEDSWLVDYIEDLRERTDNFMIYAEECDLNSLYSIRKFATKWLDNQPPRRLDGVICCAAESIPIGKARQVTVDGVEKQMGINYLAHFHLLTLLSPALKIQLPDRDVRIVMATCVSQALGDLDMKDALWLNRRYPTREPWKLYGTSKLMLTMFAKEFQRRLNSFERKDKAPCNVRVNMVNPGIMRTPSTRRFLSMGAIWGLLVYFVLFPIFWIFFKSTTQGAQSFLYALAAPVFKNLDGGNVIQECKILKPARKELSDEDLQKALYDETEKLLEALEKSSAIERKRQEKIQESKMPLADKLRAQNEESRKKADIHTKPESPEELQAKLASLKRLIGIPSDANDELPLFPSQPNSSQSESRAENLSTTKSTPKSKSKAKKSKSKKKD